MTREEKTDASKQIPFSPNDYSIEDVVEKGRATRDQSKKLLNEEFQLLWPRSLRGWKESSSHDLQTFITILVSTLLTVGILINGNDELGSKENLFQNYFSFVRVLILGFNFKGLASIALDSIILRIPMLFWLTHCHVLDREDFSLKFIIFKTSFSCYFLCVLLPFGILTSVSIGIANNLSLNEQDVSPT